MRAAVLRTLTVASLGLARGLPPPLVGVRVQLFANPPQPQDELRDEIGLVAAEIQQKLVEEGRAKCPTCEETSSKLRLARDLPPPLVGVRAESICDNLLHLDYAYTPDGDFIAIPEYQDELARVIGRAEANRHIIPHPILDSVDRLQANPADTRLAETLDRDLNTALAARPVPPEDLYDFIPPPVYPTSQPQADFPPNPCGVVPTLFVEQPSTSVETQDIASLPVASPISPEFIPGASSPPPRVGAICNPVDPSSIILHPRSSVLKNTPQPAIPPGQPKSSPCLPSLLSPESIPASSSLITPRSSLNASLSRHRLKYAHNPEVAANPLLLDDDEIDPILLDLDNTDPRIQLPDSCFDPDGNYIGPIPYPFPPLPDTG